VGVAETRRSSHVSARAFLAGAFGDMPLALLGGPRSFKVSNFHNLDCFDEFTSRFIRSKVRQLIGRARFQEADRHDLLQEFALNLLQRRKHFNPDTATWQAFVVVICENCYATILEHRRAEMRSHEREAGSLNRPITDAEGNRAEFSSAIPDSQQARRTGQYRRSHEEVWDLAHDLADVVSQMPPTMRKVVELVMRSSKAAAARELGISQGALYEILGRILTRFEKAGLRDYLK
jgi:RNA polymerase sigma factor (sigma-70 family)